MKFRKLEKTVMFNGVECENGRLIPDFEKMKVVFERCTFFPSVEHKSLVKFDLESEPSKFLKILNRIFSLSEKPDEIADLFFSFLGWNLFSSECCVIKWIFLCENIDIISDLQTMCNVFIGDDQTKNIHVVKSVDKIESIKCRRKIVIPIHFSDAKIEPYEIEHVVGFELSGILNRSISAYEKIMQTGKIYEPRECIELKNRRPKKHIDQFIMENCEILTENFDMKTKALDIYNCYKKWRDPWGQILGRNIFYAEMANSGGCLEKNTNLGMYFSNVILKND